jgi:4-alpha-glucanotransferase
MAFTLSRRASGVLLHPTSLPGPHGCGDLGEEAHEFAKFLAGAEQSVWQTLPLGPLGYGNSPYSALSAFAGNPLLISIERLAQDGYLPRGAIDPKPQFKPGRVDYAAARAWRKQCLRIAFENFKKRSSDQPVFESFYAGNKVWLDDWSLYAAIKHARNEKPWIEWEPELRERDEDALLKVRHSLREEIDEQLFQQWIFEKHWRSLRDECAMLGVALVGDLPIFVAQDSADVWAHRDLFRLDVVAGVPPDYFSATGQRWGNPLYRWEVLEQQGFSWWLQRFARSFALFDAVRLDHFIGFQRYWEIKSTDPTAQNGHWVPGPGAKLFKALGPAQLIAEDLGAVTPEVTALRDQFHFPGIKLLQFAFGTDPQAPTFLPYNYSRNSVAYTGTHDNDTTVSWFEQLPVEERNAVLAYLGTQGRDIHWEMIRAVWSSVANLAIAPAQDLLGLGNEARMNLPGTSQGNWEWRLKPGELSLEVETRLRNMTRIYGRSAKQ